jgi:signal transduction histidine kinase
MLIRKQLYRIAQEALNNVVKHAAARRAKLTILAHEALVRMRVADDGCGFEIAHGLLTQARSGCYGLASMRERAEALGGQLILDSAPGQGTIITVTLPLHH